MMQGQFTLEQISEERAVQQRRYERNRLRLAELSSPSAIVEAAHSLGLQESATVEFVEGPPVAPRKVTGGDRTSSTLVRSWQDVKGSLGAES